MTAHRPPPQDTPPTPKKSQGAAPPHAALTGTETQTLARAARARAVSIPRHEITSAVRVLARGLSRTESIDGQQIRGRPRASSAMHPPQVPPAPAWPAALLPVTRSCVDSRGAAPSTVTAARPSAPVTATLQRHPATQNALLAAVRPPLTTAPVRAREDASPTKAATTAPQRP